MLSDADKAFDKQDLEMMKLFRRQTTAPNGVKSCQFRVVDFAKRVSWIQLYCTIVPDRYGVPLRSQGIMIDITSAKRANAEQPFPKLKDDDQEALDTLFMALGVAHEAAGSLPVPAIQSQIYNIAQQAADTLGARIARRKDLH